MSFWSHIIKDQSKPTMFERDIVHLKLKARCYLNLRNSVLKKICTFLVLQYVEPNLPNKIR